MNIVKYATMGLLFLGVTALMSCKKETEKEGCMDLNAINYDLQAKKDNGSCEYKEPVANFSFVEEYSPGGKVRFFNSSTNADSYEWDFGDGTTSLSKDPEHYYLSNGNFLVTLKAKTNQGKESSVTKNVQVQNVTSPATTGQYIFWVATADYGEITVKVNGGNVGTLTSYSTTGLSPDCGTPGFVTIDRPEGTYAVTATSASGDTWSFSIQIVNGICKKTQFT